MSEKLKIKKHFSTLRPQSPTTKMILKVLKPKSERAKIRVLKELQNMSLGSQKIMLKRFQDYNKWESSPEGKKTSQVVKKVVRGMK